MNRGSQEQVMILVVVQQIIFIASFPTMFSRISPSVFKILKSFVITHNNGTVVLSIWLT